jgi:hypothetical protein
MISYFTDLENSYEGDPSLGIMVKHLPNDLTSNYTLSQKSSPGDRF